TAPGALGRTFVPAPTPLVGQQPQVAAAPAPQQASNPPTSSDDLATRATAVTQAPPTEASNMCDVQACSGMYRSFRASDCTYQPYWGGPRQMCTMRARPYAPVARNSQETTGAGGTAAAAPSGQCNAEACSRFYSSFNPSDCTYQPFGGGGRQLCTR